MSKNKETKDYNIQAVLDRVHHAREPLTLASMITAEVGADRWDEAMKIFSAAKPGTIH